MDKNSTTPAVADGLFAGEAWFDPIEAGLRGRIRGFIEAMLEEELADDDQRAAGAADQA